MATLLQEVEEFLSAHPEVSATAFGERALNDRHLVRQMRGRGRRIWPETEVKIRQFMITYRPDIAQDSAA